MMLGGTHDGVSTPTDHVAEVDEEWTGCNPFGCNLSVIVNRWRLAE